MKILKWILGLFTGIAGLLVLFAPKNTKKVKEIKQNIKENEKEINKLRIEIDAAEKAKIAVKKTLKNKKKTLKELKKEKENIKSNNKDVNKAHSRLKNIANKKRN